jgi:hypothetical protein
MPGVLLYSPESETDKMSLPVERKAALNHAAAAKLRREKWLSSMMTLRERDGEYGKPFNKAAAVKFRRDQWLSSTMALREKDIHCRSRDENAENDWEHASETSQRSRGWTHPQYQPTAVPSFDEEPESMNDPALEWRESPRSRSRIGGLIPATAATDEHNIYDQKQERSLRLAAGRTEGETDSLVL